MVVDLKPFIIYMYGDISSELRAYLHGFVQHLDYDCYEKELLWSIEVKSLRSVEDVSYSLNNMISDLSGKTDRPICEYKYQKEMDDTSVYYYRNEYDAYLVINDIKNHKITAVTNSRGYWFLTKLIYLSIIHHYSGDPIILLHSAGMSIDGNGVLFLGQSGAGKTTVARFLEGYSRECPEDISILSDETIILTKQGGKVVIAGTPWAGSDSVIQGMNRASNLKCLFYLKQDEKDFCRRIVSKQDKLRRILPQVYSQAKGINKYNVAIQQLLIEVVNLIPMYELHFTYSNAFINIMLNQMK